MSDYQPKDSATQAVSKANNITESVLVLARTLKVKPDEFATAIGDDKANATYRAKFTAKLVEILTEKQIKEADEEAKE